MNAAPRPVDVSVWHLVGPQGSGKSIYANGVICSRQSNAQLRAVEVDRFDFETYYEGRVDRMVEQLGPLGLVMISHQHIPHTVRPPHWMRGDVIVLFPLGTMGHPGQPVEVTL